MCRTGGKSKMKDRRKTGPLYGKEESQIWQSGQRGFRRDFVYVGRRIGGAV